MSRGVPRIQYERTYVLLPPKADSSWAKAVVNATHDKYKYTLGGSADDAGIGDLDVRHIVAINPDQWPGELDEFLEQFYPGVTYEYIYASTPDELFNKLSPPEPPVSIMSLRGLHDEAGGQWLQERELSGWCTIPVYVGTDYRQFNLGRFPKIKFILNLRYSYAVDDPGGLGTMPGPDKLRAFEDACLRTIDRNPEAFAFVYCNEMNNSREFPKNYALTPDYYLKSYNRIWLESPQPACIMPGTIDPFNPGWGDWRVTWKYVLDNILGCDGLAFHAYSHGLDFEPSQRFGDDPLKGVFYNLRVLESQQAIIPNRFRNLPQYITETNHIFKSRGEIGWEDTDADAQWVRSTYEYFAGRGIVGACLFRYNFNDWRISDKPKILEALKEV